MSTFKLTFDLTFLQKGAIMSIDVKLIDVPEELIPSKWQVEYSIKLLSINNVAPALKGLYSLRKKDKKDFGKLLKNIKMQLENEEIIQNSQKIERGKKKHQKEIMEVKATAGHSRLFAFLSEDNEIIICTNAYWKTSTNRKQQDREFDKAASMRSIYLKCKKYGG